METIIQRSAKGNRNAMTQLVDANAKKVFLLAKTLLKNEEQAIPAAGWALESALQAVKNGAVCTEAEFTDYAIRQAGAYCKKEVAKKDPRAFRLPPNKDFVISCVHERLIQPEETLAENYARCLPALQRFVFLLRNLGDMSHDRIAKLLSLEESTISLVADVEEENLAKINLAVTGSGVVAGEDFTDALAQVVLPDELTAAMQAYMDAVTAPMEKAEKKKGRTLGVILGAGFLCALILVGIFTGFFGTIFTSGTKDPYKDTSGQETDAVQLLDDSLIYYADIEIANYGTITVKLEQKSAPVTAANFVELANKGFYNGLTFHRIIEGFMMQGGDPNGNGTGGSDKKIVGEFSANGHGNTLSHTRGALSMARATPYNSASSQFFIVHKDKSDSLDGLYAVFGYVVEGMDVVDTICEGAKPIDSNGLIDKNDQPVMTSVIIRTEPEATISSTATDK